MENENFKFSTFFWRITASHMITYFVMGLVALYLLDYEGLFAAPPYSYLMKPTNSPWVALGPLLQVFRGFVMSIVLWFFKEVIFENKYGWLKLWSLLLGLSLLSTVGPTPGSIEGFIYTIIPIKIQLLGYIEVVPQTLLFSLMLFYWYKKPTKAWTILSIVFVVLIALMSIAGFFQSIA